MILVNLSQSWPGVLSGRSTPEEATLGDWHGISERAIAEHGDVILGVYKEKVVSAFDIYDHSRADDGRVTFFGTPSKTLAHLIGNRSPGAAWIRGEARPVKYLTSDAALGAVADVKNDGDVRRAVIGECELYLDINGAVTLRVPSGTPVTVVQK